MKPVADLDTISNESIVVTGMGLATSLGATAEATWQSVVAGRSGAGPMSEIESPLPEGRDGCQAVDLPADYQPSLPREVRYLRWTIEVALKDAGTIGTALPYDASRCAILLGTTLHGMRAGGRFLRNNNFDELRHFLSGDTLRLAIDGLGIGGGAATTCSACSSSLGSVALAVTLLQTGQADMVIAGGYDAISEYAWAGFNSLRLVADGPLLPFTRGRRGMKIGEGYAIVILERRPDAAKRNARIHATVLGYGESADAHHLTQPHTTGEGASRAMRMALDRAGIEAGELGLIAAHATGTPDNDSSEFAALSNLLGEKLPTVPVVCFKSHLGHTLGGAGAAELILSAMAVRDQVAPACANVRPEDLEYPGLAVTHGQSAPHAIGATLNTSLGFGGANTCVVLGPSSASKASTASKAREVWITGVGVLLPGVIGNEQFVARLNAAEARPAWQVQPALLTDADYEHLLNARRIRRMSAYTKYMLAAATIACGDAKLADKPELLATSCGLLGTAHASGTYCSDYYAQIVREGVLAANPMMFAEGVPNVGAAQLSLMLGLKGACQTIIGSRSSGMDALRLAWLRIASGAWDRAIVGAGEENHDVINAAYENCGLRSKDNAGAPFTTSTGFYSSEGAVAFILESADSARARGATPYATIDHASTANGDREALSRTVAGLLSRLPNKPANVLASANGSWIDRVEAGAIARAMPEASVGSIYDVTSEVYSATPLLGIAATLLNRSMPVVASPTDVGLRFVAPRRPIDSFTSLCTDWNGNAAAASFTLATTL